MALRPSKNTREKRAPAVHRSTSKATPIREAKEDASLVRALSEIVGEQSSAKAKLTKIESLIAVPIVGASSKRGQTSDSPGTDDNSVRGQWDKLGRVFKHIPDKSRNSVVASKTDWHSVSVNFAKGLDTLLLDAGVDSRELRGELLRAFLSLVKRAQSGEDILPIVAAINPSSKTPPLPNKAPMLYAERADKSQNIIEFLREIYGPWVRHGALSRPELNKYDPSAYVALRNWLKKHELPAGIEIPTKSQALNNLLNSGNVPIPMVEKVGQTLIGRRRRMKHASCC